MKDVWENLECGCMRDWVVNVKRTSVGSEESG